MADANLLEALRKVGSGKSLDDLMLFGRVRCAIKRPNILGKNVETAAGMFAIVDIYAIKCFGKDYFSDGYVYDVNRVYFTKGSMVIYIDSKDWIGKDVKVFGTSFKKGVKVRQQYYHKTPFDGITALAFSYANGKFVIVPNKLLELGERDPEVKGTLLEDFIVSIVKNSSGVIEYPITLDSIQDYSGTEYYEELSDKAIEESSAFKDSSERIDITKIKLNLEHHLEGSELSSWYNDVSDDIKGMSENRKAYARELVDLVSSLCDAENSEECDYSEWGDASAMPMDEVLADIKSNYIYKIACNYNQVIEGTNIKNKVFVDSFVGKCGSQLWYDDGSEIEVPDGVSDILDHLSEMVKLDGTVLCADTGTSIDSLPVLNSVVMFDVFVISCCTGISSERLYSSYKMCSKMWYMTIDSWFTCLIRFPYALGMLSTLSVLECDILYLSFHKCYGEGILMDENQDMRLNLIFLETLDGASGRDTLIPRSSFTTMESCYPAIASRYLERYSFPAREEVCGILSVMCGNVRVDKLTSKKLIEGNWYSKTREENLVSYGLVNTMDEYLILESDVEKEFLIYSTLIFKGKTPTGITAEEVQSVTDAFEKSRGFKLESLQRDGIYLCMSMAGVLSGCAGSGKTTTSDCMTELLKTLEGYEIIYVTPTGKACRRLAEVVKGTVRTIHSQFGVGLYGMSYLSDIKPTYRVSKPKIYLCDEMAMCPTTLLFEICKNLGEKDIIYFLGDIRQLPPIGKGTPFKLLMRLLPCIELGVSKRAAEGSLVNYNTTLLNHMSDGVIRELLYDDSTFICKECDDAVISLEVVKMWRDFMNGVYGGIKYSEEDIQVISGYQTDKYTFSSTRLNSPLQSFLRKNDKLLFKHGERCFYENDRVIHTTLNCYDMRRYVYYGGVYQAVATFGMVNGEMGKLIGVVRSDTISIRNDWSFSDPFYDNLSDDEKENIKSQYEEREDALRDDSVFHDDKTYFAVVSVHDVSLGIDVLALYMMRGYYGDEGLSVSGSDIGLLDLAYALTTHKMQGSQSPVVILPFGSKCNPYFINRNMINTMITRSTGIVGMVGTIKGSSSPINQGRQHVSAEKSKDILTMLVEGVDSV